MPALGRPACRQRARRRRQSNLRTISLTTSFVLCTAQRMRYVTLSFYPWHEATCFLTALFVRKYYQRGCGQQC